MWSAEQGALVSRGETVIVFVDFEEALRLKAGAVIMSKELLVAVLAAAGAVVEPWTSSVVGIGALLKARLDFRAGREEAMRKHAMSWLYQTKSFQAV